jgi:streptogramin lyase
MKRQRRLRQLVCVLLLLNCSPLLAEERTVENLGVVERRARIRGYAFSPGTQDYPARLLIGFAGGDGTWIINLTDGASRKAESTGFENDYLQWPTLIGADGKVFTSCGRGALSVYDPVADTIKLVRLIPEARWLRGMAIGPDGAVYVSDYPTGSAAKYDPQNGKVTRFGRQGGPFKIQHVYGYSVGCDGRYVYTAAGKMPWCVVAYDVKTGKQNILLRFESVDHPEVHQRGDKVFLEVTHGSPRKGEPTDACFRLVDGRVEPVDSIPRFDDSYVPGNDRPQPDIEPLGRSLSIVSGGAPIKFRTPGQDWKSTTIPVSGQDMTVERISPMSDGRLLVSTGPYGNVHVFDPKSESFTRLGDPASKNVYDMLEEDGRVYFCGYPNSVIGSFGDDGATLIGNWHDNLLSKHALFLVKGADGRIYSGNHNERESAGGALGWYDPQNGAFGGIRFPNDDCEHLTTAMGGRVIVYASDFTHAPTRPEIKRRNGKLLIYDTAKQEIVREISPLSDGSAGVVIETEPGVLFGLGLHDKTPMMYTVEIGTGQVGQRIQLPSRAYRAISRGPDGKVYFFVNGALVRADPKTFHVDTLCSAEPGRMVFLGNDLYIAGASQLRRVADIICPG